MCRYKNAGVAGYVEAFLPVQSDSQASEWYSYFENDVLGDTFASDSNMVAEYRAEPIRRYYFYCL